MLTYSILGRVLDSGDFGDRRLVVGGSEPGGCSPERSVRRVVEAGRLIEAVNLRDACRVAVDEVDAVAEMFEAARRFSGTEGFGVRFDEVTGFPMELSASDRSAGVGLYVTAFEQTATRSVLGWQAVSEALSAGETRWVAASLSDYNFTLDVKCETCGPTIFGTVTDGEVSIASDGWGTGLDARVDGWPPLSVEQHFAYMSNYSQENGVVAVFDADLGYIRDVWLDQTVGHGSRSMQLRVVPG